MNCVFWYNQNTYSKNHINDAQNAAICGVGFSNCIAVLKQSEIKEKGEEVLIAMRRNSERSMQQSVLEFGQDINVNIPAFMANIIWSVMPTHHQHLILMHSAKDYSSIRIGSGTLRQSTRSVLTHRTCLHGVPIRKFSSFPFSGSWPHLTPFRLERSITILILGEMASGHNVSCL